MLPATPYSAASPLFDINHIAALQSEQLQTICCISSVARHAFVLREYFKDGLSL